VDDIVDVAHGEFEPVAVAHVADEIAHERILLHREQLLHFILLEFVARKDHQPARLVALDHQLDEMLAEGAGATGDEDGLLVQVQPGLREIAKAAIDPLDIVRCFGSR